MMDKVLLFLLVFACSSCCVYTSDEAVPEYIRAYDRVENRYIQEMRQRYNATVVGTGGSMMRNIKYVYVAFHLCGEVSIEKSREVYVDFVNELQTRINADVKIRPYLEKYPFSVNDISIQLAFYRLC